MSQRESGVHAVLSRPGAYRRLQRWLGEPKVYRTFVENHLRPEPGARVLDIGCGPADILEFMPDVDYLGVDPNPAYVDAARDRFGHRARFEVAGVDDLTPADIGPFDLVMTFGVVHHLDDAQARRLFEVAAAALTADGTCVALDPFFEEDQGRFVRLVLKADRGQRVRTVPAYLDLAAGSFAEVKTVLYPGMLRLPFRHSHRVVECRGGRSPGPPSP